RPRPSPPPAVLRQEAGVAMTKHVRVAGRKLVRVVLLCTLAGACADNLDLPAVPLVSGSAELVLDGDTLVFSREGRLLLTFDVGAFQVGTVDDLDSGASFDPYWLFVDNPPAPPEGLTWHASGDLRVTGSDASVLSLQFAAAGGTA